MAYRLYLIPIELRDGVRGPAYLCWGIEPPPGCLARGWSMMDYGFTAWGLVMVKQITQEEHDDLVTNPDVFAFPENLDSAVDQEVQPFFEGAHLPTDWLTPATTWRELMRDTAGMFLFNQRYGGIAAEQTGEIHSIFDTATLDTRLRQMSGDEQAWFLATVESYGFDPNVVNTNNRLRLLVRQMAHAYWADRMFKLGGVAF